MKFKTVACLVSMLLVQACVSGQAAEPKFKFSDVADRVGLSPALKGINGHGAG